MLSAIVLGGAEGLWEEFAAARKLFTPDLLIAVNNAGADHDGPVDHWVSFHVELMPRWIAAREAKGLPPAGQLWTVERRLIAKTELSVKRAPNWGGSSGLLAVTVGLAVGCTHIVLCGVPMDYNKPHYHDPKRVKWRDAANYIRQWKAYQTVMDGRVKSMSGFTQQLLGAPTKEWFER